ncbi:MULTISPECIES: ABC transporter substrate-binding protein [Fusobacterium]|uniref:ABC transporter substrate-binding protein n=1 Tax=Fusobacterium TaxID=848 RepID=UPI001476F91E|nr:MULTISPECIES: ABC transporter substrate-binding protein [Fusobacterium]NME36646.1 ABC transporter substrate-binding protein [Fusobacterium sp. FSA-380-WT-3A]
MKKKIFALLMMLIMLVGCGGKSEKETTTTNKVVVRVSQDPDFLDPHQYVAAATGEILFNIFEGLLKMDSNGNIYPAIAESYTVSEDALTYTFKIKKGILFQNGVEVTPELVKASYDRFLLKDFPTNLSTTEFKKNIDYVKVNGEEVIFKFKKVSGEGIAAFLDGIVYEDGEKIYGTGPYYLDSYMPGEKVTLKRFKDYWANEKIGNVEEVDFRIIKDEQGAIIAFQVGEVDIIPRLLVGYIDMIGENGKIEKGEQNMVQLLALNNAVEPLDNLKVRQAIQYAVDKKEIIEGATLGEGSVSGGAISPSVKSIYNGETENLYKTDIEKAKALLKEAGYPNGLKIKLRAPANYQLHVDTAQIIKEQLIKAGIEVEIEEIEWGTWLSDVYKNRNYQMTVIGFEGKPSPYATVDRYITKDPRNMVNFSNKDYDEVLEKIPYEIDQEEQGKLYKEAQYILTENVGSVFLQAPNYIVALNKNIEGFKIYPIYVIDIGSLSIKK